jgi:hypothetical protein
MVGTTFAQNEHLKTEGMLTVVSAVMMLWRHHQITCKNSASWNSASLIIWTVQIVRRPYNSP